MAYVDLPEIRNLQSAVAKRLISELQFHLNNVDEANIPNPMDASKIISPGTGTEGMFADYALSLKKLNFREWAFPLVLPAAAATTTSTTGLDLGGFFLWDPAKHPGGTWYLEVAINISNAAGTTTAQLKNGATVIGSATTKNTAWTVTRSTALTMPASQAALTVTLLSSSTSYTAGLWAARLIYVP